MDNEFDYDLFVIGAGSGGVRAARMSAQYGAKVAIAEDLYLGGTCVNVGCVPKKLFVYASEFAENFHEAKGFGWQLPQQPLMDWATLRSNKDNEIKRLNGIYESLLENSGATLIEGRASVVGPNQVCVNGKNYSSKTILVATGGWPFVPEFPGNEHVISSNEIFYLDELPKSIVIVGGGYIAVEFAGILNGLGVDTHLVYRGPLFLRGFDQDVREKLKIAMEQRGVHLHFETDITSIEKQHSGELKVNFNNQTQLTTNLVMYATGRKPNLKGLGLDNTQVNINDKGAVEVDDFFQTAEPSIYALGDVIDRVALTPVAIREAMCLSNNLFNSESTQNQTMNYSNIPTAVFSQPNIGTVGLTQAQAEEQYGSIDVYKSEFKALRNTLSGSQEKTFMKLIVDKATQKVVGCHMLGEHAGEIIQGIGIAIKAGATKQNFDETVGIHPTTAEEFVTMRP